MLKDNNITSVLFDLDGTLADTSQDMCDSLNRILDDHKLKTVQCSELKKYISRGAVGIIEFASIVNGRSVDSSLIRSEFLEDYKDNCFIKTKANNNMNDLIDYLVGKNILVGVVTNKHSRYVNKIIEGLNLSDKLSCVVTGDMVSNPKPDIDGLIKAAEITKCNVSNTIYVGDDERDIIAGRNAGMMTVAADFGFISPETNIRLWKADLIINDSSDLKNYV
tara:strand:+ start:3463 stop:4125 length:663 start_codon:yes stop_codon:yes gene_type:complete